MVDDRVGYKCPPRHTQFKPGNNANPLGRGARTRLKHGQIIQTIINQRETVLVGGKKKKITRLERMVLRHGNDALRGNVDSALLLLALRKQAASFGDMRPITIVMTPEMNRL